MSTAARKARKAAGVSFERAPKVGTPLAERVIPLTQDRRSGLLVPSKRATRKLERRAEVSGEPFGKPGGAA